MNQQMTLANQSKCNSDMCKEEKDRLHRQLIHLGDLMGDGWHHEPDGYWIAKEYEKICRQLGFLPKKKRSNNSEQINKMMIERVRDVKCSACSGQLKQTRKGSTIGQCIKCNSKFKLLKTMKRSK
jgi:ribosomal protein L37AE/L43A